MKLNIKALAYAGAVCSALGILVLSILANLGIYTVVAAQMQNWHMFYSTGFWGTIAGMIEAAIVGFVALYVFGWFYNKFVK